MLYEKADLMNVIGKHVCRSLFFNNVLCLQAKERLMHRCFPCSFTKYFRTHFLQNTSSWQLLLNIPFCLCRLHQQKLLPSTLVILNIFEANTVNSLQTAFWREWVSFCYLGKWYVRNVSGNQKQSTRSLL